MAGIKTDVSAVLADLKEKDSAAAAELLKYFYDPHDMMAVVLEQIFAKGELAYTSPADVTQGFLTRRQRSLSFLRNDH